MGVLTTWESVSQTCRNSWLPLCFWQLLPSSMLRMPPRGVVSSASVSRSDCDASNEYEGILSECTNEGDKCCCANQRCSILDICSCRTGCESDEYESQIDFCPGDGGLDCCCRDDSPEK